MKAEKFLEKLEEFEQQAYNEGIGMDWLADIGEGLKFYVRDCIKQGKSVSMDGFICKIEQMAKEKL
ncbi:hypothetical protein [Paenibacillus sp. Leaf72]|uniref:hypothetical protein n=1 Tax=Paenibacillus sp. Leaf72 TaxID=1736234 RepID=UPI0006FBDB33|nr:hypothetical protein [Paenibacillus sp. Leaf72]KQN96999.1 hypothetical protein ASF12_23305 [Paenibacillus sp. Leaf72]